MDQIGGETVGSAAADLAAGLAGQPGAERAESPAADPFEVGR